MYICCTVGEFIFRYFYLVFDARNNCLHRVVLLYMFVKISVCIPERNAAPFVDPFMPRRSRRGFLPPDGIRETLLRTRSRAPPSDDPLKCNTRSTALVHHPKRNLASSSLFPISLISLSRLFALWFCPFSIWYPRMLHAAWLLVPFEYFVAIDIDIRIFSFIASRDFILSQCMYKISTLR